MTRLPVLSGREVVKALSRIGYHVRDQKGSHVHLRKLSAAPPSSRKAPVAPGSRLGQA